MVRGCGRMQSPFYCVGPSFRRRPEVQCPDENPSPRSVQVRCHGRGRRHWPGAWQSCNFQSGNAGAVSGHGGGRGASGSIVDGTYQAAPVRAMLEKGMTALTGAPSWTEAWRSFFEKGDVVAIKVSPV